MQTVGIQRQSEKKFAVSYRKNMKKRPAVFYKMVQSHFFDCVSFIAPKEAIGVDFLGLAVGNEFNGYGFLDFCQHKDNRNKYEQY